MDASERDELPMLSNRNFQSDDSTSRGFSTRNTSASVSISQDFSSENEHNLVGFTGPSMNERRTSFGQMSGPLYVNRNGEFIFEPPQNALRHEVSNQITKRYPSIDRIKNNDWPMNNNDERDDHRLRSGQFTDYNSEGRQKRSRTSERLNAKGWPKRIFSLLLMCIPPIMNPHARVVQRWNKFLVISCLFAAILDPLCFFVLSVHEINKCIIFNRHMATAFIVLRSMNDFIYIIHILLQFRVAYVKSKSGIVDVEDLVNDPRKIARNYVFGYFGIDLFVVLPLPQIILSLIWLDSMEASGSNYARDLLQAAIICQFVPRFYRFLRMLAGSSPTGFIFESVWANFIIHLLGIVLISHVVGSCWYLFGLQRLNQCFRDACNSSNITTCVGFIYCGNGNDYREFDNDPTWEVWRTNERAIGCFEKTDFNFGIYKDAVKLTTEKSIVATYVYSFFWGFQQISTMAGNQAPSYFVLEILFTISIIGIGLVAFTLLIGNMLNYQVALGRRTLEMSLRRRDVEQWMRHHQLPKQLKRQIRESERFNWAATRGLNEEMLMYNLPEDIQRDIRRHIFKFVKKVGIFQRLDEPIIDAIYERLRKKTYIKGSKLLVEGGLVDKVVFITRGKMESIEEDLPVVTLSEGDVCGEELLTWCLEHSSLNKDGTSIRFLGHRLLSKRLVRCLTNVEAFVLRAADLEEVASLFARSLRSQGAIRNERGLTGRRFRVAWRYRKKGTSLAHVSSPVH